MQDINDCKCQDLMFELIDPDMEKGLVAALTHDVLKNGADHWRDVDESLDISVIRYHLSMMHNAFNTRYPATMHFDEDTGLLHIDMILAKLQQLRAKLVYRPTIEDTLNKNFNNKTYIP